VSRSITRPLRSLTRQAKEMAERRLPDAVLDILETPLGDDVQVPQVDPVVVNTRDEVADVSAALNTVQDTALDLAVEQAVLRRNIADSFVNLGRRNQNLLGRQLDFITELETNETDPDTLANLFRLDHLATRMRRNAESLLVLAGIEPPRKWAAPVRLTDVIRAALGEVEDYQRVTVRGVEPATIIGSAAADLAHLLAELIENALVFSPPDQTVDIRGRNRPAAMDEAGAGYVLAVIDGGMGMPTGDVAAANRRLAGDESFTIAPSKYLGHYVAGNLAARHNITVHLDNSPGNGITATVDIPSALLTSDGAVGGLPTTVGAAGWDAGPPELGTGWDAGPPGVAAGWDAGPPPGPAPAWPAAAPAPVTGGTPALGAWPSDTAGAPAAGTWPADEPAIPAAGTWPFAGPAETAAPPAAPAGPAEAPRSPEPAPAPAPLPPRVPAETRLGHVPNYGGHAPEATLRTASGLARRPTRATAPGTAAGASPTDDAIVASLGPYTRGWDAVAPPPAGAAGPAPLGRHAPSDRTAPFAGRAALARRVRGAQLPDTSPIAVRRTSTADGPRRAGAVAQHHAADAVYRFLTDFTAGVQRGLTGEPRDGGACP
jgi:signal transduction histidine kinase